MTALSPDVLALQAGHARYRAVELRAMDAAAPARRNAAAVAASRAAAGAPTVDGGLPDNPIDAAAVLEARAGRLEVYASNDLARSRR